jgi:hypothetical protein
MWGSPDSKATAIAFHSLSQPAYCEAISMTVPGHLDCSRPAETAGAAEGPAEETATGNTFQNLQLLEHAVRQPFQKLPGIGTLPAVSYFVTVISHENQPEKSALRSPSASF